MDDLYTELQSKIQLLEASLRQLRQTGTAFAQAERDYKVLLRTECLKLKDGGMAIGLLEKVCYGIPSIAEARFKRDVAEAVYRANQEAINTYKLEIRILDSQISREWSAGGDSI